MNNDEPIVSKYLYIIDQPSINHLRLNICLGAIKLLKNNLN